MPLTVLPGRAKAPLTGMPPLPPALQAYAGESAASAEVTAAEGGLAVRFGRGSLGRLELTAPDVFRRGAMIARFDRNVDGAVTGFSYGDPLTRGLRFARRD